MIDYLPPNDEEYINVLSRLYELETKNITFQVTEDCCLNCTYCYQHHKTNNKMTFNVAKTFIDQLLTDQYTICTTKNTNTIILEFIGGEPLLEISLIDQIVTYIYNKMIELQHPWLPLMKINICSNGILYFNPEVQSFFKKFHQICSFTISIDGNKELHDACRIDKFNNGSYDKAIAAMKAYRKDYHIQMSTKMTLSPENIKYTYDAIINLIKEGYTQIYLNCIYENVWNKQYANILYSEMIKIADYLILNNLYNKIFISLFNENLFKPIGESNNENYCGGVADKNLALNYKGEFFPCVRYMESSLNGKQKPLIIGDIINGYLGLPEYKDNYKLISNITRKSQSSDKCFNCPIALGCGWCSAFNYEETGCVNKRTTYICLMHQARALANQYYWNKLYKKLNIQKQMNIELP